MARVTGRPRSLRGHAACPRRECKHSLPFLTSGGASSTSGPSICCLAWPRAGPLSSSKSIRCVDLDRPQASDALTRLHLQCFRPCEFDAELFAAAQWWLAISAEQGPLGFAGLSPGPTPRSGYLCRAGVAPSARGQGLHKRLIQVRLAFARRIGLQLVVTDTLRNPRSEQNLVACGFEPFVPRHPWALVHSRYWRLSWTQHA